MSESQLEKDEKFHKMFISSLERNCSGGTPSANQWELLSTDLGMPVDEVRVNERNYVAHPLQYDILLKLGCFELLEVDHFVCSVTKTLSFAYLCS